jgi:hypothetical protein
VKPNSAARPSYNTCANAPRFPFQIAIFAGQNKPEFAGLKGPSNLRIERANFSGSALNGSVHGEVTGNHQHDQKGKAEAKAPADGGAADRPQGLAVFAVNLMDGF